MRYTWLWTDYYQTENNNTNEMSDVMMIKFEILWMSSEQYWIVNQILIIEHVYALFKKALTCEMIIY